MTFPLIFNVTIITVVALCVLAILGHYIMRVDIQRSKERMKHMRLTMTSVPAFDIPGDKYKAGIYTKYYVRRTDGKDLPGEKHDGCFLFVLDVSHDPHALPAIQSYADSCQGDYPILAQELRDRIKKIVGDGTPF